MDLSIICCAAFHDLGLIKKYSSATERFEVDGANAVRQFLTAHSVPEEQVQTAWEAIALHTTPGVTQYMKPEVALLFTGVGLDVLGEGFDNFPAGLREQIVKEYPRHNFKEGIVKAFFGGFEHKPSEPSAQSRRMSAKYMATRVPTFATLSPTPRFPTPNPSWALRNSSFKYRKNQPINPK